MTVEERSALKAKIDRQARQNRDAWIARVGSDYCEWCGLEIGEQRPGKRFCSTGCQHRAWDAWEKLT